eukprot:350699-Pleurochrysis_carterae.AAC.1
MLAQRLVHVFLRAHLSLNQAFEATALLLRPPKLGALLFDLRRGTRKKRAGGIELRRRTQRRGRGQAGRGCRNCCEGRKEGWKRGEGRKEVRHAAREKK